MTCSGTRPGQSLLAVVMVLAAVSCKGDGGGGGLGVECPDDLMPCGNGCRPRDAVCCDDGSFTTSSYCTNAAGGGCYPNDRGCAAAFPAGTTAQFCCSSDGTIGSNDCPPGQRHCGLLCRPVDEPCCRGNECRYSATGPACPAGKVHCAYDLLADICWTCSPGFCCGGPAITGGCYAGGGVCRGTGGGDNGDDCVDGWRGSTRVCVPLGPGGSCSCSGETDLCIGREDYESATGLPFPDQCAPEGTLDCLTSDNRLRRPCCPGLTCASTLECGQDASGGIGQCVPL